jgi:hypothetical protein
VRWSVYSSKARRECPERNRCSRASPGRAFVPGAPSSSVSRGFTSPTLRRPVDLDEHEQPQHARSAAAVRVGSAAKFRCPGTSTRSAESRNSRGSSRKAPGRRGLPQVSAPFRLIRARLIGGHAPTRWLRTSRIPPRPSPAEPIHLARRRAKLGTGIEGVVVWRYPS